MTMSILPLATADQFKAFGSAKELIQKADRWPDSSIATLMVDATTMLQSRCQTRLSPFTSKVETHQAIGISPDEYGQQGDIPMDLTGALGWSQAAALGVNSMVREFWLDDAAPMYPEWWSYNLESVKILRTFGDSQLISSPADFANWQGPDVDTGHVKMPIGTYCPIGSMIVVTYGGGYNPIPGDLKMACIFQGMKLVMLGMEPAARKGVLSMDEIDAEIAVILGAYSKS
jgi:hypothetical protein